MAPTTTHKSTLEGRVERITYRNPVNDYTVARIRNDASRTPVTVTGHLTGIQPGDTLKLTGTWETHPKFGQQFKAHTHEMTLPASVEGIEAWLAAGAVKGIGPSLAKKLIRHFGADTLQVLTDEPAKLMQVEGIGEARAEMIIESWQTQKAIRELITFLTRMGVKTTHAGEIYKTYAAEAVPLLHENPYRLVAEVPETGFRMADQIAGRLGVAPQSTARIGAYIRHLINGSVTEGHVFEHVAKLTEQTTADLDLPDDVAGETLTALTREGDLILEPLPADPEQKIAYPPELHFAEVSVAGRLRALLTVPLEPPHLTSEQIRDDIGHCLAIELSDEQLQVLTAVLHHRAVVVTGGPGTGKTTLIRALAVVFDILALSVMLAAPTGRAARRLAEVSGKPAATIHRLLVYNPAYDRFEKNRDDPLEADVVIIDETSMVDIALMRHLLDALPVTSRLILVGDVFQLPSVGPGNVLGDIIASGAVPAFELTHIFRQATQSPIIINAHRVRRGELPQFEAPADPDGYSECYYIQQPNPEIAARHIVELCQDQLPAHFGLDPIRDIQVLTPMHKGAVGTIQLNQMLQAALNDRSHAVKTPLGKYAPGDKVMHLKNNYPKDVFNGDIGIVTEINTDKSRLRVAYEGRSVAYAPEELDELTLAYAISVHKSQGSEYPAVIVPIMTQHYILLQRNLLYTAMTRGKNLLVLIGTWRALEIAVQNDTPGQRRTLLAERLSQSPSQ